MRSRSGVPLERCGPGWCRWGRARVQDGTATISSTTVVSEAPTASCPVCNRSRPAHSACPAVPGVTGGFHVLTFETERWLVLRWRSVPGGAPIMTWAFVLEERADGSTRLIVRARARRGYSFYGLPACIGVPGRPFRTRHHGAETTARHRLSCRVAAGDRPRRPTHGCRVNPR